jgi:hypothetical protein
MWLADLGSRPNSGSNHSISNYLRIFLDPFSSICIIRFIHIMSQLNALLQTLDLQESAQRKGHFSLFNCLVLGHTKYRLLQGCAVGLLQSVSDENVLRKSSNGSRHDSAAGHRQWSFCCVARVSLICSCIAPVLCFCYDRHWIQVL